MSWRNQEKYPLENVCRFFQWVRAQAAVLARQGRARQRRQRERTCPEPFKYHPHGGQLGFVWLSARTPHGAYVWCARGNQEEYPPEKYYVSVSRLGHRRAACPVLRGRAGHGDGECGNSGGPGPGGAGGAALCGGVRQRAGDLGAARPWPRGSGVPLRSALARCHTKREERGRRKEQRWEGRTVGVRRGIRKVTPPLFHLSPLNINLGGSSPFK